MKNIHVFFFKINIKFNYIGSCLIKLPQFSSSLFSLKSLSVTKLKKNNKEHIIYTL